MDQQNQYEEIDLMDYARVIIKRKRMIFVVFLITVIAVVVYSFFICPKVYQIDTLIEIGKISNSLIEQPTQIVEKIDNDVYGAFVRAKLKIPEDQFPKIKTENPAGTELLTVQIESKEPELAKKILEEINSFIIPSHFNKIAAKEELIKKDIERLENKIALLEEDKENLEKKEKSLEWLSPYERVNEQLTASLFILYDVREKLSIKRQEIENLYIQVNSMESSLEDILPTTIVKSPTVSESPIKPKPVLNIVIGAVLGVFLGIFFGFSKEWWEKNY